MYKVKIESETGSVYSFQCDDIDVYTVLKEDSPFIRIDAHTDQSLLRSFLRMQDILSNIKESVEKYRDLKLSKYTIIPSKSENHSFTNDSPEAENLDQDHLNVEKMA